MKALARFWSHSRQPIFFKFHLAATQLKKKNLWHFLEEKLFLNHNGSHSAFPLILNLCHLDLGKDLEMLFLSERPSNADFSQIFEQEIYHTKTR